MECGQAKNCTYFLLLAVVMPASYETSLFQTFCHHPSQPWSEWIHQWLAKRPQRLKIGTCVLALFLSPICMGFFCTCRCPETSRTSTRCTQIFFNLFASTDEVSDLEWVVVANARVLQGRAEYDAAINSGEVNLLDMAQRCQLEMPTDAQVGYCVLATATMPFGHEFTSGTCHPMYATMQSYLYKVIH
jgi:hypothetical protein